MWCRHHILRKQDFTSSFQPEYGPRIAGQWGDCDRSGFCQKDHSDFPLEVTYQLILSDLVVGIFDKAVLVYNLKWIGKLCNDLSDKILNIAKIAKISITYSSSFIAHEFFCQNQGAKEGFCPVLTFITSTTF